MRAARRFDVRNWYFTPNDKRFSVQVTRGGQPHKDIDCDSISVVEERVMDWQGVSHIHSWFVDKVQGGIDNCASYIVSEDKLRKLSFVCKEVMRASKLVDGTAPLATSRNSENSSGVELCEPCRVIEDPTVAKKLLPTREGPDFGSTEYDEDYLNEVELTRSWAEQMLSDLEAATVASEITYSSSRHAAKLMNDVVE